MATKPSASDQGQVENSAANKSSTNVSCAICGKLDNDRMVGCNSCDRWQHFTCVGEDFSERDQNWSCAKCLELPTDTSAANIGVIAEVDTGKSTDSLEEECLNKLSFIQEKIEQALTEKDNRCQEELMEQRKKHEQELKDSQLHKVDQLEVLFRSIRSVWGDCLTLKNTNRLDQQALAVEPAAKSTDDGPPPSDVAQDVDGDDLTLALKMLEEKQALERKHFDERLRLLQRKPQYYGGAAVSSETQMLGDPAASKDIKQVTESPEELPYDESYETSTNNSDDSWWMGKVEEAAFDRLLSLGIPCDTTANIKKLLQRPEIAVIPLVHKIRALPCVDAEDVDTLDNFIDEIFNMFNNNAAQFWNQCDPYLIEALEEKLPAHYRLMWELHKRKQTFITVISFYDWLQQLYDAVAVACIVCFKTCGCLEECQEFLDMHVADRWAFVKDERLCKKCLRKHYGNCGQKQCGRNGCTFQHHKLVHDDNRYK